MIGKVQVYAMNADNSREITPENLWDYLTACQGEVFYTKKGLPFTYYIKGGELFASRRERSITRSTFEKAYRKLLDHPKEIVGPKSLNVYGAPYVWAILEAVRKRRSI